MFTNRTWASRNLQWCQLETGDDDLGFLHVPSIRLQANAKHIMRKCTLLAVLCQQPKVPFSSAGGAVGVVWALESSENATASYEWVNQNVSNNCLPDLDFCWWLRWTHRFGPWRLAWSRPHRQGRLPGAGRGAGRGGTCVLAKNSPQNKPKYVQLRRNVVECQHRFNFELDWSSANLSWALQTIHKIYQLLQHFRKQIVCNM